MAESKTTGDPAFTKEIGPTGELAEISESERPMLECLPTSSDHQSPKSTSGSGHIVYVRGKAEPEFGKTSFSGKLSDAVVCSHERKFSEQGGETQEKMREAATFISISPSIHTISASANKHCRIKVQPRPLPKCCRMKVQYPQQGYHSVQMVLREKHDKFMLEYYESDFGAAPLPFNLTSHGLLSVYATQLLEKEAKIFEQKTEGKRPSSPMMPLSPPTPPPSPPHPPPADGPPLDIMGGQQDEEDQEEEENGEEEDNEEEDNEEEDNGEEHDLICQKVITKGDAERLEIPEELRDYIVFPAGKHRVTIFLRPYNQNLLARELRLRTKSNGMIVARRSPWEDVMYFCNILEGSKISFHIMGLENYFWLDIEPPPEFDSDDDESSSISSSESTSDSESTPSQLSASSNASESSASSNASESSASSNASESPASPNASEAPASPNALEASPKED